MSANAGLELRIDWIDEVNGEPATSFAAMSVCHYGTVFWPTEADSPGGQPLEWYADRLLSHLTKHWKRLVLEQGYPIPVQPSAPSSVWERARARWSELPRDIVLREDDQLMAFDKAHDLANAFGGMFGLGCLWLVREYNYVVLDNGSRSIRLPYEAVVAALNAAGDRIAERLSAAASGRWDALVHRWNGRNRGDPLQMLRLATNLPSAALEPLLAQGLLPSNDQVMEVARETEVKVAARMAGGLSPGDIADVIRAVKACPPAEAPLLDRWSERVMARLRRGDEAFPFEQGVMAADAMREILGVADGSRVDPFELFDRAGVVCREETLNPDVDAVACWGASHGPAVVINAAAKRLKGRNAVLRNAAQARVTAAHELCHLLLDRNHMLSTVEVLGGRTPLAIEQRARAFAPAFLLPGSQALKAWDEDGQPTDPDALKRLLRRLCERFGVTRMVAAWKLEHGIAQDPKLPLVRAALDGMMPSRTAWNG